MKNTLFIMFLGIILVCSLSCHKDKTQSIPAEINEYVLSFFEDARNNGLDIYLEDYDLFIEFTAIDETSVDGRCNTKSHKVEIDSSYWKIKSFEDKTKLIYHELAHCILKRGHFDERFSNGECKSIMRSGFQEPSCWVNFVSKSWIDYYKQEVFTNNRDLPTWYDMNALIKEPGALSYNLIAVDTIITDGNRLRLENLEFDENENFQVCITYHNWQIDEFFIHFNWNGRSFVLGKNKKLRINQGAKYYFLNVVDIDLQASTTFCFLKKNNFYHFFIDGNLVHVMDYETWEDKNFYTNSYDVPVRIQFSLFNF